jgi:predicted DNA repair protein MutK
MAGFSLLALLDDISTVLDDVAMLTKLATKKTAGVLGDDLALTAQQVFGVRAKREIPVVLSVAKGSLVNKLLLIPGALLLSHYLPWLINPLLMIGGAYLCAEGGEKVFHLFAHKTKPAPALSPDDLEKLLNARQDQALLEPGHIDHIDHPSPEAEKAEKKKIAGAVRTDFVLSTEIIVITLGSIPMDVSLPIRAAILVLVGLIITFGVYGFVALIVKLDDIGFWLAQKYAQGFRRTLGKFLILAAPKLMKFLTFVGTAAMFIVGGGILAHGFPWAGHLTENFPLVPVLPNILWGFLAGAILTPTVWALEKLFHKIRRQP